MSSGRDYQKTLTVHKKPLQKTSFKYLGLFIDSKLTFRDHFIQVVKKLKKHCGLIYRVRDIHPIKCLLLFFNENVRSVICDRLLVYGRAVKTNLEKIELA